MSPSRTLVLMPAWNEEAAIGSTIRSVRAVCPDYDLLVIDDGSSDETAALARDQGAIVISLPYNLGVGGALRTGYRFASRRGYERAIQVDADGQHDPAEIERVLAGLAKSDICIGARFAGRGSYAVGGPRRLAMVVLAWAVSRIARVTLTDVTSGFRAANRTAIEQYARYFPAEYLGDTVDSLVVAVRSGLTVTQVPVAMKERQGGKPSTGAAASTLLLGRSILALLVSLTRRREGGIRA